MIRYVRPDDGAPHGEHRTVERHVALLNEAGVAADVLDGEPGAGDVVVVPATRVLDGVRTVVFEQRPYGTFTATDAYRRPGVEAAIVVTDEDAAHLRELYPGLPVHRVAPWQLGLDDHEAVLSIWRGHDEPLASIAILTLNGIEHTRACLESIERHTNEPHELVLVDNGSTDGTVEYLRRWVATHPNARLVANEENTGFAGGNNQALALARGRYLVLLNNDTIVTPGWLTGLVRASERTGAGLVGPVSNYVAGPQLVEVGYTDATEIDAFARAWQARHEGESEPLGRLVGFCLLFTREVLDSVGALDETFGAGNFEDDDFCLRARGAGHSLAIARDVFVHHTGSRTFVGQRIDYRASIERNARVFVDKWGCGPSEAIAYGPAAVAPGRLPRLVHIPLPEPPALDAGADAGETAVDLLLERGRDAVVARDYDTLRGCFADAASLDDPQRGYQAVRHLAELVLTAGETIADDGWLPLYEAAADGLLGALERTPSEPFLLNVAGVLLYELTEADAAAALFGAGLRLDPALVGAADNLAAARSLTVRLCRPACAALAERAQRVAAAARPAEGLTLSLCMIVKDEEELLPGCLAAAKDAVDEIVVVDTGSSDRTVEIAESFGAKVVHFPWNGSFADARNVSIEHATGDWVLYLDADEHLAEGSAAELRSLLGRTWREAFYLLETNLTGDEDAGTAVSHPAMRLFRNRPKYRFEGRIHEQKTRNMPTYLPERFETTGVGVTHYGYLAERVEAKDKSRRNIELLEADAPSPYSSFNLGSEYLRLEEWDSAATHLDAAWDAVRHESQWQDVGFAPLLALRAARARRAAGRLEEARELLRDATGHWADFTDLTFELAFCAKLAGDTAEAERLFRRCLELGDAGSRYAATVGAGTHLARTALAELAELRGDDAEAEALHRRALAEAPTAVGPVLPLTALLLRRGIAPERLETELPLDRPRARLLAATACLEAGHAAAAESLLRRGDADGAARLALVEALLAQRRYAEAAAEALREPAGSPTASLAASWACFARVADGDRAGFEQALVRARAEAVDEADLALYGAWAGAPSGPLPAETLEPALVGLDALLRAQDFGAFERLVGVYERIDVAVDERRERLARLYFRRGFVDSAEDEWLGGDLDVRALVGLAQVELVREQPGKAAEWASKALAHDPSSPEARKLVEALAA